MSLCVCVFCWYWTGYAPRSTGLDHRAETTLPALSRHPPPNPTCPSLDKPPSPPPVAAAPLLHRHFTHTLLSYAVCQSVSLPPLPPSGQSFSLSLYIPPPLFFFLLQLQEQPAPAKPVRLHLHKLKRISSHYFSKLSVKPILFLYFFPLERLTCVRGLWCRALYPKEVPKGCDWRRKVFTTMNRQLLLLLALVGPFCAFTHASKWTILLLAHCVLSLPLPPCAHSTPLFVSFNPCRLNNNSLECGFRWEDKLTFNFLTIFLTSKYGSSSNY